MQIYETMRNILLEIEKGYGISIKDKETKVLYYTQEVFKLQTEILRLSQGRFPCKTLYAELDSYTLVFDQEAFWKADDVKYALQSTIYQIEQYSGGFLSFMLCDSLQSVFSAYILRLKDPEKKRPKRYRR